MSSAICFNLDQSKILSFGVGLTADVYEPFSLNTSAKTDDSDQPVQNVQADQKRNLLLCVKCLPVHGSFYLYTESIFGSG